MLTGGVLIRSSYSDSLLAKYLFGLLSSVFFNVGGFTSLFFVLSDFVIDNRFVSEFCAEVLHGLGVAVRAVVGANAGGGQVQGVDFPGLSCCEFGAESAALAAEACLVTNPDWFVGGLEGFDDPEEFGEGFAGESEAGAGVCVMFQTGIFEQSLFVIESLHGDNDWDTS